MGDTIDQTSEETPGSTGYIKYPLDIPCMLHSPPYEALIPPIL
jgi:hypothetical protein